MIAELSEHSSAWHRMDVVRAICDLGPERPGMDGRRWVQVLDRAVDSVLDGCVDLDPDNDRTSRRGSDGRSVWIEPVANRHTSTLVLAQEEAVLALAAEAASEPAVPSATIERGSLDVVQADAAAAVAGHGPLVVIIGPAGAGKTTMLDAAVTDLAGHGRDVFGVAPTAKAAAVLARETGMDTDTVHVRVRVAAPPWIPVDELRVRLGGEVVAIIDLTAENPADPFSTSSADVLRYDAVINVTNVTADSFITAEAGFVLPTLLDANMDGVVDPITFPAAPQPFTSLVRGAQPIGFVNPVFLDRDGNGQYNPPGMPLPL